MRHIADSIIYLSGFISTVFFVLCGISYSSNKTWFIWTLFGGLVFGLLTGFLIWQNEVWKDQESITTVTQNDIEPSIYNKPEDIDASTLGKSAQSTAEEIASALKKEIAPQIKSYETTKYPPDITKAKQTLINSINQFNPNQKLGDISTIVPGYFELSADPSPNSHYSSSAVETKDSFSTHFYASIRLAAVENVQTMDFMGRDIWVCINPSWAAFMIWETEQSQTVWKPIRVERNPVLNTVAIYQNGRIVSIFINNNYVDSFKKLRSPKPGPISIAFKANKKNGGKMFFRDVSVWDFGVP